MVKCKQGLECFLNQSCVDDNWVSAGEKMVPDLGKPPLRRMQLPAAKLGIFFFLLLFQKDRRAYKIKPKLVGTFSFNILQYLNLVGNRRGL